MLNIYFISSIFIIYLYLLSLSSILIFYPYLLFLSPIISFLHYLLSAIYGLFIIHRCEEADTGVDASAYKCISLCRTAKLKVRVRATCIPLHVVPHTDLQSRCTESEITYRRLYPPRHQPFEHIYLLLLISTAHP